MRIPDSEGLVGTAAIGHISFRPFIPDGRCSQGGVKIPTGGKGDVAQARERLPQPVKKGQQIRCDSEADG
jgi:hypothetical protein